MGGVRSAKVSLRCVLWGGSGWVGTYYFIFWREIFSSYCAFPRRALYARWKRYFSSALDTFRDRYFSAISERSAACSATTSPNSGAAIHARWTL